MDVPDSQTAADVAEATECVQAWLDTCDRVAEADGGWAYAFGPEDTVFADALRTLLADRARMEQERNGMRTRLADAQVRLDYFDSRVGAVRTMAFLESELARTKVELEQVRGERDASRDVAERANNLLMLLVLREGGSIQLSQADLVRASESLNFWITSRAALLADLARLEASEGAEATATRPAESTGDAGATP